MARRPDPERYGHAWVWVTWITGLLAGTDRCQWKPWYKARHQYAKLIRENDFNMDAWEQQHQAMVDEHVVELQADGWPTVTVEDANKFQLKGDRAILSGKPDIVAVRLAEAREALVIDEKGGSPKPEHRWQVKVYLYALARLPVWKHLTIRGMLAYRGVRKDVTLDPGDGTKIGQVMAMIVSDEPPAQAPSAGECETCDIHACPVRIAAVVHTAEVGEW